MCIIHISEHHSAPKSVLEEAKTALSHFPQLANVNIDVRFKKHIRKSTMQAQPVFSDVLRQKKDRGYVIYISKKVKITGHEFSTKFIPSNIIIGWLGHELGHICDYQNRSSFGLIVFGLKYLFSGAFLRAAERSADTFAISNGMHRYILATKNFILDHADIPRSYKRRIQKYYLSPEEIMMLVEEKNQELHLSESN
ncbi:hypothetical protein [Formosa sp. S-31]|uniref:hypothetical protein n=1 Tax=Formosa sp. S-31 TaxID=2790949 RepID=UPI003EC02E95